MNSGIPTRDGAPGIWGSLCVYAPVGRRCSLEVKLRKLGKLRRARSALAPCRHGRAWASAVTNGSEELQVVGPPGQVAGMMHVDDSDCGPKVGGLTVGDAVLLPRWQPAAHIPRVAHGVHLRSRDQT